MILVLSIFWFLRQEKALSFWVFLWQLKEYQVKRVLDHFHTEKGQRIIFNKLNYLKIILALFFLFYLIFGQNLGGEVLLPVFFWILTGVYVVESLFALKNFIQGRFIKPVFTGKTIALLVVGTLLDILLAVVFFSLFKNVFLFSFLLLAADIMAGLVFCLLVLAFQPFSVFLRNQTIKKAKLKRLSFSNLIVIGITGSYGKTSVKEFLSTILSERFSVLSTKEHQNSEIGIAQRVLNDLKPEHKIFVVEMASYGKGGIKLLADMVKPKIGILTGINEQHLSLYGSQENIVNTKYELIEGLSKDGTAVFNGDNPWCRELYQKTNIKKLLYKTNQQAAEASLNLDIWAEDIITERTAIKFRACLKSGDYRDFKVNVLGGQNVQNLLAAILVAKELGMSLEDINKGSEKIMPEQAGMKLIKSRNGKLNIIDSSYSANHNGVISALEYLKVWKERKFIVMPCLIELGRKAKEIHFEIGAKIGEVCDGAIITSREYFEDIQEGAARSGMDRGRVLYLETAREVNNQLSVLCGIDDVVLLEGRVPDKLLETLINKG